MAKKKKEKKLPLPCGGKIWEKKDKARREGGREVGGWDMGAKRRRVREEGEKEEEEREHLVLPPPPYSLLRGLRTQL